MSGQEGHIGAKYTSPSPKPSLTIHKNNQTTRTTPLTSLSTHRKFWKQVLPRIKYRNPSIPVRVSKVADPEESPILTIVYNTASPSFTSSPASTATPTPLESLPTVGTSAAVQTPQPAAEPLGVPMPLKDDPAKSSLEIQLRDVHETQIWAKVRAATNAQDVEPLQSELDGLREIQEQAIKSQAARERTLEENKRKKKEEEMLRAARGELMAARV